MNYSEVMDWIITGTLMLNLVVLIGMATSCAYLAIASLRDLVLQKPNGRATTTNSTGKR